MLKWQVYNFNCNRQTIELYNCLSSYEPTIKRLKKTCSTKAQFAESVRREMQYRFWSRAEYEVILTIRDDRVYLSPWVGCRDKQACTVDVTDIWPQKDCLKFAQTMLNDKGWHGEAKIDIYDQIMFYFDDFISYLLNYHFKYERKKVCKDA